MSIHKKGSHSKMGTGGKVYSGSKDAKTKAAAIRKISGKGKR